MFSKGRIYKYYYTQDYTKYYTEYYTQYQIHPILSFACSISKFMQKKRSEMVKSVSEKSMHFLGFFCFFISCAFFCILTSKFPEKFEKSMQKRHKCKKKGCKKGKGDTVFRILHQANFVMTLQQQWSHTTGQGQRLAN